MNFKLLQCNTNHLKMLWVERCHGNDDVIQTSAKNRKFTFLICNIKQYIKVKQYGYHLKPLHKANISNRLLFSISAQCNLNKLFSLSGHLFLKYLYFFIIKDVNSENAGIRLGAQNNISNRKNFQFSLHRKNSYNNKNGTYY